MGFLQQVAVFEENAKQQEASNTVQNNSEKSNTVGLLKRIIRMNEKNRLDFFDYVNKYNLSQCAVFRLNNGIFQINTCYGFDCNSILKSVSTLDFWDGLIPQKNTPLLFSKKDNSIQPLYQFFSDKLIDAIDSIVLYRSQDDVILFCSSSSIETLVEDKDFFAQFSSLDKFDFEFAFSNDEAYFTDNPAAAKANTYIINLYDSIKDFIDKQNISDNQKLHFEQVIFYNIYYSLRKCFPKNPIEEADYSINLYIQARNSIPKRMLEQHLILTLKDILGDSSSKLKIILEPLYNKKNNQAAN